MSNKEPRGKPPKSRIQVATYLAMGFSQEKAASSAGIARSTVQRWLEDPEFAAMVQDFKAHGKKALMEASKKGQLILAQEFQKGLVSYMKIRQKFFERQIEVANKMLDLVDGRLEELDSEYLQPNLLGPMMTSASKVAEQGFAGWAEQLGIVELQRDIAALEEQLTAQEIQQQDPNDATNVIDV